MYTFSYLGQPVNSGRVGQEPVLDLADPVVIRELKLLLAGTDPNYAFATDDNPYWTQATNQAFALILQTIQSDPQFTAVDVSNAFTTVPGSNVTVPTSAGARMVLEMATLYHGQDSDINVSWARAAAPTIVAFFDTHQVCTLRDPGGCGSATLPKLQGTAPGGTTAAPVKKPSYTGLIVGAIGGGLAGSFFGPPGTVGGAVVGGLAGKYLIDDKKPATTAV